jgi:hypothetical protein
MGRCFERALGADYVDLGFSSVQFLLNCRLLVTVSRWTLSVQQTCAPRVGPCARLVPSWAFIGAQSASSSRAPGRGRSGWHRNRRCRLRVQRFDGLG